MVVAPLRRRRLSKDRASQPQTKKPPGKTGRFVIPGRAQAEPGNLGVLLSSGFRVQPAAAD
jgi:hypothetical protein